MKRLALVAVVLAVLAGLVAWALRDVVDVPPEPVSTPHAPAEPPAKSEPGAPRTRARAPAAPSERPADEPARPAEDAADLPPARRTEVLAMVVDADGRPLSGVEVRAVMPDDADDVVASRATDPDGVARLLCRPTGRPGATAVLVACVPATPAPRAVVALDAPPPEPVRLVVAPGGTVRCEVVDVQGRAAEDGTVVELRGFEHEVRRTARAGAATFAHVAPGAELTAVVEAAGEETATARAEFSGPSVAGEQVTVRLVVGVPRLTVAGRLVDGHGAPAAGFALVAELTETGGTLFAHDEEEVAADAEGRFRVAFDRPATATEGVKVRLGRTRNTGAWSETEQFALLPLPPADADGVHRLGDVVAATTSLLCSGVVVDHDGSPVHGATVSAVGDVEADAVETDEKGRFELLGRSDDDKVRLAIECAGRFVAPRPEVARGTEQVRIVMAPAGSIAGSVRLPPGVTAWDLRIVVSGSPTANGGPHGEHGRGISADLDGRTFEVPSLAPGSARVELWFGWGDDDLLAAFDDVRVVAGTVTRDPRLQSVDLDALLRSVRVVALDEAGKPVAGALAHAHRPRDEGRWQEARTGADGVAEVRLPASAAGPVDVVVLADGFRAAEVRGVEGEATVKLERARPATVRVRLAADSPLPEPPHHLTVALEWCPADGAADWADPRNVDDDQQVGRTRVVALDVATPGRYRVALTLWEMEMGGGSGGELPTRPRDVTVVVPPEGGAVEVVVHVDPKDLERAVAGDDAEEDE